MRNFKKKYKTINFINGFSLIEVLIVSSILIIIASMSVGYYVNYSKSVEVDSLSRTIVSDLKQAQSKSMIGAGNFKWGIHFENGAKDYYEIFSTPTDYASVDKVIVSKNYLLSGIVFIDPSEGTSKDIIFNKISGGTNSSSISVFLGDITKTINVSNIGNISEL